MARQVSRASRNGPDSRMFGSTVIASTTRNTGSIPVGRAVSFTESRALNSMKVS
jgi:hypothetical protein